MSEKSGQTLSWIIVALMLFGLVVQAFYWTVGFAALTDDTDGDARKILHIGATQIVFGTWTLVCFAMACVSAWSANQKQTVGKTQEFVVSNKERRHRLSIAASYFLAQSLVSAGIVIVTVVLCAKMSSWNFYKEAPLAASPTVGQLLTYVTDSRMFYNYYVLLIAFTTIGVYSLVSFSQTAKAVDADFKLGSSAVARVARKAFNRGGYVELPNTTSSLFGADYMGSSSVASSHIGSSNRRMMASDLASGHVL